MKKDIKILIIILLSTLILLIVDYPNILNKLENEGFNISNLPTLSEKNDFYDYKQQENQFWNNFKYGEDSIQNTDTIENIVLPTVQPTMEETIKPTLLPTITSTPTPIPKLEVPLTFMLIGDSMMIEGFGPKLELDLINIPGNKVLRYGKYSTGLNRIDKHDWFTNTDQYLKQTNPDVLVVFFGANDGQKIYDFDTKRTYELYTPQWEETYRKRVIRYLDIVSPKVKKIYWMGHPIPGNLDFYNKFTLMNRIYKEEIKNYPNVVFVDSWDRFAINGKYSAYIKDDTGKNGLVKHSDGVHLTIHGSAILSQFLINNYLKKDINF